jgi:toxin ParE1/3/4
MRRVSLTRRAQRDLVEILEYIARDSPLQAAILVDRLERAALDLANSAELYQRMRGTEPREVRRRVVSSYNIVYAVTGETIEVLTIAHGARNLAGLLAPDN